MTLFDKLLVELFVRVYWWEGYRVEGRLFIYFDFWYLFWWRRRWWWWNAMCVIETIFTVMITIMMITIMIIIFPIPILILLRTFNSNMYSYQSFDSHLLNECFDNISSSKLGCVFLMGLNSSAIVQYNIVFILLWNVFILKNW